MDPPMPPRAVDIACTACLAHTIGAHDVDLHQPGQLVRLPLVDARFPACRPGVVDQRGQRPRLLRPVQQVRHVARRRHVRTHRNGPAAAGANGGDHRFGSLRVRRVVDDHAVPVICQPFGDRGADTPAGAGDDHHALSLLSCRHVLDLPPSDLV
jgi:hypothetical protein